MESNDRAAYMRAWRAKPKPSGCSIDGCDLPHHAKGMCNKHFLRLLRVRPKRARKTPAERFWPKVDKNGPIPVIRPDLGACWVWVGNRFPGGYGRFNYLDRQRGAHAVSYEWAVGPVPSGLELDHLCRNPSCVNPTHLEAVTHRENVRRGLAGRCRK